MKPTKWFVKRMFVKGPILGTVLASTLSVAHDIARTRWSFRDIVTYSPKVPAVDTSEEGRLWWREHGY